jgi:peroxiredoxin
MQQPHIEGTHVPHVIFKTRVYDEKITPNPYRWHDVCSEEIFSNKNIVLFALPGAFTPTCSSFHLPGYEGHYEEFKKCGVDEVYCLSVNDAFVMWNWMKEQEVKNLKFIPDGSGDFTRALGMMVKKENLGFGERSWRYSMYVENGLIQKTFIEAGFSDNSEDDPFDVSDAETMLVYLKTRPS